MRVTSRKMGLVCALAVGLTGLTWAQQVELEVVASQPEYLAQEQEIWKIYEKVNPNVKIKMMTVNEDTQNAFATRVAAGNPPDIQSFAVLKSKEDASTYVNLLDIGYPYFDKFQYNVKTAFAESNGVPNVLPVLAPFSGPTFSFIYYEDDMAKAGLKPRESIRTMADLDKFLAQLKVYTDKNKIPYVLDTGWHSWCWMNMSISMLATATGGDMSVQKDLWINGKIKWTDLAKNPYVPAFKKLKEWYEKGYLPQKWWTRDWEKDFEAGFIAKKSILTFHGPWLWTKVAASNPGAKLAGFPLPANKDGVIQNAGVEVMKGSALFAANKNKPNFKEAVKAFIWFNSPEIIKLRAEAFGQVPAFDLGSVGSADLGGGQYNTVVKPINDGYYGKVKFDSGLFANGLASKYRVKNKANVMEDDAMAPTFGEYFEGKIAIEKLMSVLQQRFDDGYAFPKK